MHIGKNITAKVIQYIQYILFSTWMLNNAYNYNRHASCIIIYAMIMLQSQGTAYENTSNDTDISCIMIQHVIIRHCLSYIMHNHKI